MKLREGILKRQFSLKDTPWPWIPGFRHTRLVFCNLLNLLRLILSVFMAGKIVNE